MINKHRAPRLRPTGRRGSVRSISSSRRRTLSSTALAGLLLAGPLASSAHAEAVVVPLGTSAAFSVLSGSTVTNTGSTTIERSVGVAPGTAITGATSMTVGGTYHQADAVALEAKKDLTTAYTNAEGQTPRIAQDAELGGQTLAGGVYNAPASTALTGALTLDGQNDPDSVWVFQTGSTLTTASASSVVLINGANPCNVFWQVGSSATLGTSSNFVGTVMADQTITMNTGATLQGRAMARTGAVNLDANVITTPECGYDSSVADGTDEPTPGDGDGTTGDGDGDGTTNGTDGSGSGDQVPTLPSGGVDTGQSGSVDASPGLGGHLAIWLMTAAFAVLAAFGALAGRRRRRA